MSHQTRRILAYLAPYKLVLALALGAKILSSGMFLALPAVIEHVVDTALVTQDMARLNQATLLLLGVFAVLTVGTVTGIYYTNYAGERIIRDLRRDLFTHLNRLSLRFFTENRMGELLSRMSSDVMAIRSILTTELVKLLRHVLTIAGALAIMVVLNWRLTLFILLTTPLITGLGVVITRFSRQGGAQVQRELADATVIAAESFQNAREVKSFVREDYETSRYLRAVDRTLGAALKLVRNRALFGPLVHFLFMVNITLIVWYGGREVMAGRLSSGELIAFLVYVAIIGQMFSELGFLYTQVQETLGATERVFQLLDLEPDVQDAPDAVNLSAVSSDTAARISFEAVSFSYEGRQPVLHDINLTIEPGEILALVGPSGAGKSTIFNLIPRFYDVTQGAIRIDGYDVRAVTQASLREQIGIVPQETLLFGGSIRENIQYGRLDASPEELIAAAQAANAHEFIMDLPDQYDTPVGERGVRLSGGQRQRVAIARAILKDPRILLLDEATASLDNESEHLVQEALERLMQGRTTVIIAHRLSTIRIAHRIAVLESGRIVELGTHEALLARGGLYARLYAMQFRQEVESPVSVSSFSL